MHGKLTRDLSNESLTFSREVRQTKKIKRTLRCDFIAGVELLRRGGYGPNELFAESI